MLSWIPQREHRTQIASDLDPKPPSHVAILDTSSGPLPSSGRHLILQVIMQARKDVTDCPSRSFHATCGGATNRRVKASISSTFNNLQAAGDCQSTRKFVEDGDLAGDFAGEELT